MQCVTRVTGSYAYLLGPKCDSFICVCVCVCVLVTQLCPTLCDPWTVAHQAPLSMGFPRQEYWSGLPFPFLRIFPTQGWNLGLLPCRQILYHLSHQESLRVAYSLILLELTFKHCLEKEMATHSSILAWRIPGSEEPGGLLSMGLNRVGHD